ncbi:MAG: hypothetical protein ACOCP8_02675 [archaeon]
MEVKEFLYCPHCGYESDNISIRNMLQKCPKCNKEIQIAIKTCYRKVISCKQLN